MIFLIIVLYFVGVISLLVVKRASSGRSLSVVHVVRSLAVPVGFSSPQSSNANVDSDSTSPTNECPTTTSAPTLVVTDSESRKPRTATSFDSTSTLHVSSSQGSSLGKKERRKKSSRDKTLKRKSGDDRSSSKDDGASGRRASRGRTKSDKDRPSEKSAEGLKKAKKKGELFSRTLPANRSKDADGRSSKHDKGGQNSDFTEEHPAHRVPPLMNSGKREREKTKASGEFTSSNDSQETSRKKVSGGSKDSNSNSVGSGDTKTGVGDALNPPSTPGESSAAGSGRTMRKKFGMIPGLNKGLNVLEKTTDSITGIVDEGLDRTVGRVDLSIAGKKDSLDTAAVVSSLSSSILTVGDGFETENSLDRLTNGWLSLKAVKVWSSARWFVLHRVGGSHWLTYFQNKKESKCYGHILLDDVTVTLDKNPLVFHLTAKKCIFSTKGPNLPNLKAQVSHRYWHGRSTTCSLRAASKEEVEPWVYWISCAVEGIPAEALASAKAGHLKEGRKALIDSLEVEQREDTDGRSQSAESSSTDPDDEESKGESEEEDPRGDISHLGSSVGDTGDGLFSDGDSMADFFVEHSSKEIEGIRAVRERLTDLLVREGTTDSDIVRFLIARAGRTTWNIDATCKMLTDYYEWFHEFKPQEITRDDVLGEIGTSKAYFNGFDHNRRPIVIIIAKKHNPKVSPADELIRYVSFVMEYAIKIMSKLRPPVEKFTIIADVSGVGRANVDMEMINKASKVFQLYYPERMGRTYIVNAPYLIKLLWKTVKLLVEERTQKKIEFVDKREDLLANFDLEKIPRAFGGTSDYEPPPGSFGEETLAPGWRG